MPSFQDFPLQPATHAVLANMQIIEPTPIQAESIPALLAGKDLVGRSATGSGKTLAYSIPLVERLAKERVVQALVLVPTRELAVQVNTVLSKFAAGRRLSTALLVGGRAYGSQISALRYGSQIVVGTPGRVKDHLDRGTLVLNRLRICVLDEADQMLDSGFAPAIEEILVGTPEVRQMALFSATMPDWVEKLQQKFLKDPVKIDVTPSSGEQSTIEQIAYQVPQDQKIAALCTLLHSTPGESSLVFGKTKYGVEKLGKQLSRLGFAVETLHGNKSQRAREAVLSAFRHGEVQTLLATNVAARGLDITGIYQVINYELPESSELFTHRIGRTGRMGRHGKAITLLVPSELSKWRRMARSLGQAVSLQKLAINEEAMLTPPAVKPASIAQEAEQRSEEPLRGRRQFVEDQEREDPRPLRGRKQLVEDRYGEPRGRRQFAESQEREDPRPLRGRRQFVEDQEREDLRPLRSRKAHATDQEHGKIVQPKHDSSSISSLQGRQREHTTASTARRAPVWQTDGPPLPTRSSSGKMQDGRKIVRNQPGSSRGADKRKAFVTMEAQHQTGRRTSRAVPMTHGRRAASPKRSAGR